MFSVRKSTPSGERSRIYALKERCPNQLDDRSITPGSTREHADNYRNVRGWLGGNQPASLNPFRAMLMIVTRQPFVRNLPRHLGGGVISAHRFLLKQDRLTNYSIFKFPFTKSESSGPQPNHPLIIARFGARGKGRETVPRGRFTAYTGFDPVTSSLTGKHSPD